MRRGLPLQGVAALALWMLRRFAPIVAPDLPGFEQSDMPPRERFSHTFDNIAKVIIRFTDALNSLANLGRA